MQSFTSPKNNYKAAFEISPSGTSDTQIRLKENNLWNDSFVKVVNQTSVVLADSTMKSDYNSDRPSFVSSMISNPNETGKAQPVIRTMDVT